IEARFEKQIAGVKGRELVQVDGRTDGIFTRVEREPIPGASIELTIDTRLQQVVERELEAGVRKAGALGGSAIILDPFTGEILAQASYPTYNPNDPAASSADARHNRAVQDIYEPGSTFKIVTASAALNEHVLTPSTLIDTNPGVITFPGRAKPIDEDKGHNYGVLSFEDVIVKSSNVGAVKIGLQVGVDRMMQYVRRFGFGKRIAPDYGGESPGMLTPVPQINDSALASMSMGYQVGVTPIQMVTAASVVANGGVLMQPHLVRAFIRDGRREEVAPKLLGRVISPETALTLTGIMEGVVDLPQGTGNEAQLTRYQVAGKTGTAAKLEDRRYSEEDYNVSFVGFVPSRRPAFAILVVVDTPTTMPKYGGRVAAPIFRRIAETALEYTGVAPTIDPTPPIMVASDRRLLQPPVMVETPPVITRVGGRPVMPDLRGLMLRDAIRIANALGLSPTTEGDGFVVSQTPAAGEFLSESGRCTLVLRRATSKPAGGDR
ncbi:MAG TPA: penicillin-binding protein, partial [Vicinamibacterales bacterium]|nr:penicillin-binding protein [Vicinamibacterales bacterium]